MISSTHYAGIGAVILIISLVGLYSTRLVKSSSDFVIGGRKLGAVMVCGGIVGAFAGGTVTIGTAQMAYQYGIGGIWFTLGAGAACLTLSIFLAGPLRDKQVETIPQFLSGVYGPGAGPWVALFTALGMYIQLTVQMLASVPLVASMFPVSVTGGLFLFACFALILVLGGGFMGASLVGIIKLFLMTFTLFTAGAMSWSLIGGAEGISREFSSYPWLSMFPRGKMTELAGGMSVVVGFISTQSFIQPIFGAKNSRSARVGAMMAALAIPCFGLAGVLVGMFMRSAHPGLNPAAALPLFMLFHQPPWIGGLGVATLFISLVMTASALALGISTLLSRDIYSRFRPASGDRERLFISRALILAVMSLACVLSFNILGDLILDWTYLSNALRGVTVFLPLVAAVFLSGKLSPGAGIWAVTIPPLFTLAWAVLAPGGIHPLYAGLPVSLLIMAYGFLGRKNQPSPGSGSANL